MARIRGPLSENPQDAIRINHLNIKNNSYFQQINFCAPWGGEGEGEGVCSSLWFWFRLFFLISPLCNIEEDGSRVECTNEEGYVIRKNRKKDTQHAHIHHVS